MGLMKQLAEQAEAALKKDRVEMHERNLKQMADLAKIVPSPTIAQVQAAMGHVAAVPVDEAPAPAAAPAAPVTTEQVDRASEAEAATSRGGYKTRDARAVRSVKDEE